MKYKNNTYVVNFYGKDLPKKYRFITIFYGFLKGTNKNYHEGVTYNWKYYAHINTDRNSRKYMKIDSRESYSPEADDNCREFKSFQKAKDYIISLFKQNIFLLENEFCMNELRTRNKKMYECIVETFPEYFI